MSKQQYRSSTIDLPTYIPVTTTTRFTRKTPSKLAQQPNRPEISSYLQQSPMTQKNNVDKNQTNNKQISPDISLDKANMLDSNVIGLVGNVFMGSTNRYVKGQVSSSIGLSKKDMEYPQTSQISLINANQPSVKPNKPKYTKYFQIKPKEQVNRETAIKLDNLTPKIDILPEKVSTDRSNTEGNKKIQRKHQQRTRDIKFKQKKEPAFTNEQRYTQIQSSAQISQLQSSEKQTKYTPSLSNFNQLQKTNNKNSACIFFVVKRLIKEKIFNSFKVMKFIKLNQPYRNKDQIFLLRLAILSIIKYKQNNLLMIGFETLKQKFTSLYAQSTQSSCWNPFQILKIGVSILDRFYQLKLRQAFVRLKSKQQLIGCQLNIIIVLDSYLRNKNKSITVKSFSKIKDSSTTRKQICDKLINSYLYIHKTILPSYFNKLLFHIHPDIKEIIEIKAQKHNSKATTKSDTQLSSANNTALLQKITHIKNKTAQIEAQIPKLNHTINTKTSQNSKQKKDIKQKLATLKQQNQQMTNDLSINKQHNQTLKNQIQKFPPVNLTIHKKQTDQYENQETKLSLLVNLYYNLSTDAITWKEISNRFCLKEDHSNKLLREWQTITLNFKLENLIFNYENNARNPTKVRVDIQKEQALISKLMRSYLKEHYCWEWIHLYSQST